MKENKIELQLFARRPNIKPHDETIAQTNSLIRERGTEAFGRATQMGYNFLDAMKGINIATPDLKWYFGYDFGTYQAFPPMPYDMCKFDELASWYSGNIHDIENLWGHSAEARRNNAFWSKDPDDGLVRMHLPVAGVMAQTSADLLFSDFPDVSIPEAEPYVEDGNKKEGEARAIEAFERLRDIIAQSDLHSILLEASETCSAMGGVFLKVVWDADLADYPIVEVCQADNAIPEFKYGILTAVTFWKVIKPEEIVRHDQLFGENKVYRLLERHEKGVIYNALYCGTSSEIGEPIPFEACPQYANLDYIIQTQCDRLLVEYIPNIKPNRLVRGSALGQSDLAGLSQIFDAIDETYSSLMRDIRLARARLLVPETMLDFVEDEGGQKTAKFDNDKAVYAYGAGILDAMDGKAQISANQFAIRVEEHINTILDLIERAITYAGYSPQTFGLKIEGGESGTALNIRERKTYITRQRKWKYWESSSESVFQLLLFVDNVHLGNGTPYDYRPSLQMNDNVSRDPSSIADIIQKLSSAQALSVDTKVRMLHPDWEEDQVEAEVELISKECGIGMDMAGSDMIDDELDASRPPMEEDDTESSEEPPVEEDNQEADEDQ